MKHYTNFPLVSILFIAGLALVAAGCTSTSTGPGPTISVKRPGVGSTFITHFQEFDTLSHSIASRERFDTTIVISSGITYQGKTNVVAIRKSSDPSSGDVQYLNYESNGDLSGYIDGMGHAGDRSGWETYPLASKGTTSFIAYDSTGTVNGHSFHDTRTDIITYTGEENVTEAGQTFDALVFSIEPRLQNGYKDYTSIDWLSPQIGFLVKETSNLTVPDSRGAIRDQTDLVSYILK